MKKLLLFIALLSSGIFSTAQNTGIGTNSPQEKLEVNGAIKIGTTATANAGTIRYQSANFEGYNGSSWKAFTQLPAGTMVVSPSNPNVELTNAGFSFFAPIYINKPENITTTANSWLGMQTFNAAAARTSHTAVWTGTKMIVWGGAGSAFFNTGSIYDPATDTWTDMSPAPIAGRYLHSALWIGDYMVVWGGYGASGYLNDGAIYKPATDTWIVLNPVGAPDGRFRHSAVWTGTEMIIWGGISLGVKTNTGAKYSFSTNTWTALPTASAPSARGTHTAVWTGTKMLIWGGEDAAGLRLNDGAIYNNATNTWDGPITTTNAPVARYEHTAIWTGTEMVVWGGQDPGLVGFLNSGGKYNPTTNTWTTATSLTGSVPAIRAGHTAVWTGTEILVYGGYGPGSSAYTYYNTGGRYNPTSNSWTGMGLSNAPVGRTNFSSVWAGNQMVVFGGFNETSTPFNSGGRYFISSETNISTLVSSALYLFSKD